MRLINGDCVAKMQELEANSVDTIITDPPYGLEFMGKEWDKVGQSFHYRWAAEALRVAKPGAIMICFGGSRTFHRIACEIEDAGWEIRDTIMWLYGSGFPKSYNIGKGMDKHFGAEREVIDTKRVTGGSASSQIAMANKATGGDTIGAVKLLDITAPATPEAQLWDGWGTALKPAFEPIIVAMKPRDGTFVENALKWGVAGLNIDGGRVGTKDDTSVTITHTGEYTLDGEKGNFRYSAGEKTTGGHKGGRWPANIIHDGLEEDWSRYFYCAKASKAERNAGLEGMPDSPYKMHRPPDSDPKKVPLVNKNNHPTVKPLKLMEYLCTLTKTPTGGIVLDPFMGSGTTGIACRNTGRDFIGIELDEHYFNIATKRIYETAARDVLQEVDRIGLQW